MTCISTWCRRRPRSGGRTIFQQLIIIFQNACTWHSEPCCSCSAQLTLASRDRSQRKGGDEIPSPALGNSPTLHLHISVTRGQTASHTGGCCSRITPSNNLSEHQYRFSTLQPPSHSPLFRTLLTPPLSATIASVSGELTAECVLPWQRHALRRNLAAAYEKYSALSIRGICPSKSRTPRASRQNLCETLRAPATSSSLSRAPSRSPIPCYVAQTTAAPPTLPSQLFLRFFECPHSAVEIQHSVCVSEYQLSCAQHSHKYTHTHIRAHDRIQKQCELSCTPQAAQRFNTSS